MKKRYIPFILASLSAMTSAYAQQLPNPGFEGDWENCIPWTSKGNTKTQGTVPSGGWNISHTVGTGTMGQTSVGEATTGKNSEKAVLLCNEAQMGNVIPAYLTLGTSWSTSLIKGTSVQSGSTDGGTFGGIAFTYRPDAIQFDYIHLHDSESTQPAKVIAYSWSGEWIQKDVPGDNAINLFGTPKNTTVTMTDRDRNILGISTARGGEITQTGTLVSSLNYTIDDDGADWKTAVAEFEYKTNAAPEKFNVIFASFDYFADRSNHMSGDALTVDNVKLLYYSRLASISVNGTKLPRFSADTYEYEVSTPITNIEYTLLGGGQTATATQIVNDTVAIINVSNTIGEDADGESTHTYILRYVESVTPEVAVDTLKYDGALTIEMLGNKLTDGQAATIEIAQPEGSELCTFVLPNFMLDLGDGPESLGDIVVENVQKSVDANGTATYKGEKKGLELAEGLITADVSINGTITAAGVSNINIDVVWEDVPISVVFTSTSTGGISGVQSTLDTNAEYYNLQGVRVAQPTKGIYLRKQGDKTTKIFIK
jgi:hypothetical protein